MTEIAETHDGPSQWLVDIVKDLLETQEQENLEKTTLTLRITEVELDFDDYHNTVPEEEQDETIASVLGKVFEIVVDDEDDEDEIADAVNEWVEYQTGWCAISIDFERVDEPCEIAHTE